MLDQLLREMEENRRVLPKDMGAHELLQMVYREIEKRANRPPPSLSIEGKAVEVQSAEELKGPFPRMRRRA